MTLRGGFAKLFSIMSDTPATSETTRRKKQRPRILESVEYFFARVAFWLARHAPPRLACRIAKFTGSIAYWFMPRRRRIAVGNILKAGITDNVREAVAEVSDAARPSFAKFRRRALETTQKLERLMARAPRSGCIFQPKIG